MKVKIFISIGLMVLLILCATPGAAPVYAIPALPHAFYGTVDINGSPAPIGTRVSAIGTGVTTGVPQNPLTTTTAGQYGDGGVYLLVQGDIVDGATITFYVNGVSTGQTTAWHSGETTELNLTVTISAPSGGDGAAPPAAPITVEASLFGGTVEFSIDNEGVIQETIEATSEDGNLTITIPKDTIALDKDGDPLSSLTSDVKPSPPDPPEDAHIIGLAYDFGPDGATFDPAITFTWNYGPDTLPDDVDEADLVIAYYDEVAGEWVELPCTVDTENNTITASVEHFTAFAVIGAVTAPPEEEVPEEEVVTPAAFSLSSLTVQPMEVEPNEAVTIAVSVANTGGTEGSYTVVLKINGVKEEEQGVTVAASGSEIVTFSVTREEAGSYSVTVDGLSASFTVVASAPPPAKPINWPLIGGITGGVVVVGLVIFFLVVRRRA